MTDLTALNIAHRLKETMPGIGVCSKSKKIDAYLKTVKMADEIADGDTDLVVSAIEELVQISKPFSKALFMAALNLNQLNRVRFTESAWIIANSIAIKEGFPTHRYYRHLAKLA